MDLKCSPSKYKDILVPELVSGPNSSGRSEWIEVPELFSSFGLHAQDGGHGLVRDAYGHLNCTKSFSVVAWVRYSSEQGDCFEQGLSSIVSKHGPAAGWELRANRSMVQFVVTLNTGQQGKSWHEVVEVPCSEDAETVAQGWYQLAGTYDGHTLMAYVNGNNFSPKSFVVGECEVHEGVEIQHYSGNMGIGCNPYWSNRYVNGDICGIRIYTDRVLSAGDLNSWLAR